MQERDGPSSENFESLASSLRGAGVGRALITEGTLTMRVTVRKGDKEKAKRVLAQAMPPGFTWVVSGSLPWWGCLIRRFRIKYIEEAA